MPRAAHDAAQSTVQGYAVDTGRGVLFFPDIAPALTFAVAGRMSHELALDWNAYKAAVTVKYCAQHGDERVLWLGDWAFPDDLSSLQNELRRFVDAVLSNPGRSTWVN
ncbi:hypothetical protein PSU4_50220 [Pseudonocardia sulfidoxydans NBRC 16205]|uniref:Uncharacterized protein n=1 Tax=Pseudonocardia sulfidoxydans NBRC 16205 TaxID=1223511 RepID=A0A511DSN2_9PSEU|nr:hypothetical protein PSU4_50220 [Pseudonocardia sulfidoxydans NBRC 16205]